MTLKILHINAAGNQGFLQSMYERELGYESDVLTYRETTLNYGSPKYNISVPKGKTEVLKKLINIKFYLNYFKIIRAIKYYDIIHMYGGYTFIPVSQKSNFLNNTFYGLDFALLRQKKIFIHYQGCEVRVKSPQNLMCLNCSETWCTENTSKYKKRRTEKVLGKIDAFTVSTPDLIDDISNSTELIYYFPQLIQHIKKLPLPNIDNKKIRVIHAPTNSDKKGTDFIKNAFIELVNRGIDIELVELKNVPNSEVSNVALTCDFAIDQVLSGWYGRFSVEMMGLGLPVFAYIKEEYNTKVFEKGENPIIRVRPNKLADDIEKKIIDLKINNNYSELSSKSLEFVKKNHYYKNAGQEIIKLY